VHVRDAPLRQRGSVARVLQESRKVLERGEGTCLQCLVDEVLSIVGLDGHPLEVPASAPLAHPLYQRLHVHVSRPPLRNAHMHSARPLECRQRTLQLLQRDCAHVSEVLAHHPPQRLARPSQPRRVLVRQQRQQVLLPHGHREGSRREGLRIDHEQRCEGSLAISRWRGLSQHDHPLIIPKRPILV
jgi:hypothetical protein